MISSVTATSCVDCKEFVFDSDQEFRRQHKGHRLYIPQIAQYFKVSDAQDYIARHVMQVKRRLINVIYATYQQAAE